MVQQEARITKRKLRSSYLTSIISIALVLFLLGLAGLLVLYARKISVHVKENIGFSVILKENIKEVDVISLQKTLDAKPYRKSTQYITKEQAAKETMEYLGEDFIDFLGYNPLLASIEVHLKAEYANPDSIAIIEKDFQGYDQVKEVIYQKSLVNLVNENIRKISLYILAFGSLLLLIATALINNTIRLSIYAKRFSINTMQLVGATNGFIRRPFLIKGALHGVIAASLSIGLLIGFLYLASKEFEEILSFNDIHILAKLFVIVLTMGIVINWISTYFAVTKYLRMKVDNLYL